MTLPLNEVYEALDDNEVALQNMMGNRFMGFFEAQITDWKGKLGTVRSVLEVLLDVQRSWCSLESIFLGSEDIREQLPEDAKRFDGIDLFLSLPHTDIDSTKEDLKGLVDQVSSKGLVVGSLVAPVWPPTGGGSASAGSRHASAPHPRRRPRSTTARSRASTAAPTPTP